MNLERSDFLDDSNYERYKNILYMIGCINEFIKDDSKRVLYLGKEIETPIEVGNIFRECELNFYFLWKGKKPVNVFPGFSGKRGKYRITRKSEFKPYVHLNYIEIYSI